jgi:octopine/nopaline transport system substrate-binding protein
VKLARILGVAAAIALAAGAAQAKDWKHVTIATEGAYPPWNMHAPDGKLIGFEIDLGNDLCARMKVTCDIVAQEWNGIIPGLNAGKYDAIMAGMSITPERLKVVDFTVPYTSSPTTFMVMKDDPLAKLPDQGQRVRLEDEAATNKVVADLTPMLKGKTVGAQVSTIQADLVKKYFPGTDLRTYGSSEEMTLDLKAGRIDAMCASAAFLQSQVEKPGGDKLTFSGPGFTGGLLGKGTGVAVRKSDPELRDMFDVAIRSAIADGTVKQLAMKWFHVDLTPPTS